MAYQENIPQPTDTIRNSQNDILNNFQSIKPAFDTNHVEFDNAAAGKHKFVTLPEQGAAPAVAANDIAIYSKNSTLSGIAEIFVKNESGAEYEFTSSLQATPGWTRLPSGILIKWGQSTLTGADTATFPVAGTIPVFTTIFSVQLTVFAAGATDTDGAVRVVDFSGTADFDVFASARSTTGAKAVTFDYLAIGV